MFCLQFCLYTRSDGKSTRYLGLSHSPTHPCICPSSTWSMQCSRSSRRGHRTVSSDPSSFRRPLFIKSNMAQQEAGFHKHAHVWHHKSTLENAGHLLLREVEWGWWLRSIQLASIQEQRGISRIFCLQKKKNLSHNFTLQSMPHVTAIYIGSFFSNGKVSGWGSLPGVCGAAEQCGAVNVITALWQSDNLPVCLSTQGKCSGILNVAQ